MGAQMRGETLEEFMKTRPAYGGRPTSALDQSSPVAAGNERDLVTGEFVLRHVGLFIGAVALAIGRIGE